MGRCFGTAFRDFRIAALAYPVRLTSDQIETSLRSATISLGELADLWVVKSQTGQPLASFELREHNLSHERDSCGNRIPRSSTSSQAIGTG